MKLDHIGIAVADLEQALGFYRDALGLSVQDTEEVASQRVRAHFVAMDGAKLELLEATSVDSPIATYLAKRGPGIHHLTFEVDDLAGALARLRIRGVRLIDETPRAGAEGARVAFIHPSSAHGVLVELKQASRTPHRAAPEPSGARSSSPASNAVPPEASAAAVPRFTTSTRYTLGDLELIALSDGFIHLDGGAMFGVVPRTLWEKRLPPDSRNRIPLGMRPLLVRGEKTLLIDAGCGDKMDAKSEDIYGLERAFNLEHALAQVGVSCNDIDLVLATHLHFDHVGGFTERREDGAIVPRFPRARYVAHRLEWEDAAHPHERNRASYLPENFEPLADAGVLTLVDDEAELMPGARLRRSGGHTRHHQVVTLTSAGRTAVFAADMYPTSVHVPDTWGMGYDLYPMETLAFKRAFAREAIAGEYLIFFEHDPSMAAGIIHEQGGKRTVERVI